jgi:hypothetical protein
VTVPQNRTESLPTAYISIHHSQSFRIPNALHTLPVNKQTNDYMVVYFYVPFSASLHVSAVSHSTLHISCKTCDTYGSLSWITNWKHNQEVHTLYSHPLWSSWSNQRECDGLGMCSSNEEKFIWLSGQKTWRRTTWKTGAERGG